MAKSKGLAKGLDTLIPTGVAIPSAMKETKTPAGYHTNNTTYKLVYNENTKTYDVLTLDDQSSEQIRKS